MKQFLPAITHKNLDVAMLFYFLFLTLTHIYQWVMIVVEMSSDNFICLQ